jgi:protein gp37
MGDKSNIEWTDATWNPIVGCSIVSPGCTNCYAMKMAARIEAMSDGTHGAVVGERGIGRSHYTGTTKPSKAGPVWTGKLALAPEHSITAPLRWKKPRMIFVNSMGDLFHEDCPDEWIDQVFAVMALCPQHTFQVLTKRAERMRACMLRLDAAHGEGVALMADMPCGPGGHAMIDAFPHYAGVLGHPSHHGIFPLPNVWLGVSTEDQQRANERIPHLLQTPAAVRFISAEPLLGAINLQRISLGTSEATFYGHPEIKHATFFMDALRGVNSGAIPALDWVIAGGESGLNARPMHPDWARSLRDQCAAAGVPFFFKQWGEWSPGSLNENWGIVANDGELKIGDPKLDIAQVTRVGKARAGRLLDGREHNGMPEVPR